MALVDDLKAVVIKSVTGAKSFKGAKAYTSKKGNEGLILSEFGGFIPEPIMFAVAKDGKKYRISLKFSVSATEESEDKPSSGGNGVL